MAYKRLQVAQHFGRDTETVRRWSIEFAAYLSHGANSQGRNKSLYTDEDIEKLALIRDMYDGGRSAEDIHIALKTGQKGEFDGFLQNSRVTLTESQSTKLTQLVRRVSELEQALAVSESKNQIIPELQAEIKALNREIGKLQFQIELLNKKE
jgi:DNA-binding transcriptional MerR regulator